MKVMVLGGTGFLGWHAVKIFLERGHEVTVLALDMPAEGLLPPEVKVKLADLNALSDDELRELLKGQDAVAHCAGADDRVVPKAPAYDFFYKANVVPTARLFKLAAEAGVKRGVMMSSYFCHFARIWPELSMADHHMYVKARFDQEKAFFEACGDQIAGCVLELGYIFGRMPGRTPLWDPIVQYLRMPFPLFYPTGGTNMITVQAVGEAIVGAIEKGRAGEVYVVGDENHTWEEMLQMFGRAIGKVKKVHKVPYPLIKLSLTGVHLHDKMKGKEAGLFYPEFAKLQCRNTFVDNDAVAAELGYTRGGIEAAIADVVSACPPRSLLKKKK